ncbi:hypothetical protein [Nostoc phage YongM]|nr:hypothetical protein [Nostoc phage YongM]
MIDNFYSLFHRSRGISDPLLSGTFEVWKCGKTVFYSGVYAKSKEEYYVMVWIEEDKKVIYRCKEKFYTLKSF